MALKQTINMKLQQRLALAPQLQIVIKLLHMTRAELEEELIAEIEKNPLLEDENLSMETEEKSQENEEKEVSAVEIMEEKIDVEAYFSDYLETSQKYKGISYEDYEGEGIIENLLTKPETLFEHLMWQIRMAPFNTIESKVAELIVGNLRPDGYLDESLEKIAKEAGCSLEVASNVLFHIQKMDPVGVGARNLKECLVAQLNVLKPPPLLAIEIVENYIEEIAESSIEEIAKKIGRPLEEVEEAIRIIKNLDPKPGLNFESLENFALIPDVFVEKNGDKYEVKLNDDGLPKLRLNRYYKMLLERGSIQDSKELTSFLKEKLRLALSFLKGVEERQKTIYNVATFLVEYQKDFLDKGPSFIKPLVLKDVAERVGVHESTVSRVVSNKYMLTPKGIIPMKSFFSTGIQTIEGRDISQERVKSMIRKLIDEEFKKKPLSDQQIASILKREGILLARRTVAKYREEMGIPPSSKRAINKVNYRRGEKNES